jgi:hypothetical protein
MAVEAEVVVIHLALAVRTSSLVHLHPSATGSSAVAITVRLVLLAAAGTPASVLGRPATSSFLSKAHHCLAVYRSLPPVLTDSESSASSRSWTDLSRPVTSSMVSASKSSRV